MAEPWRQKTPNTDEAPRADIKWLLNVNDFPKNVLAEEVYLKACGGLNVPPDALVQQMLEATMARNILDLNFSTNYLSQPTFTAVMELVRCCPSLQTLDFSSTHLKTEYLSVLVGAAYDHPSLTGINLSDNPTLGFNAARQLLPLIKQNKRIVAMDVEGTMMAPTTKELIAKISHHNQQLKEEAEALADLRVHQEHKGDGMADSALLVESYKSDDEQIGEGEDGQDDPHDSTAGLKSNAPDPNAMDVPHQRQRNLQLKTSVLEHEERIVSWFKDLVAKAEQRPKEAKERQYKGADLMQDFEDKWKWSIPADYLLKHLVEEARLHINEEHLDEYAAMFTPMEQYQPVPVTKQFAELLQLSTGQRRKAKLIEDLLARMVGHGPGMTELIGFVGDMYDLMHLDDISMLSIKNLLSDTDDQVGDLKTRVERLESNRRRAIDEDDLMLAESYQEETIDTLEKLIDLILYRLKQLLNKGSRAHLLHNVKVLCQKADDQLNATRSVAEDLTHKASEDMQAIAKRLEDETVRRRQKEEDFASKKKRYEDDTAANMKAQDKCWKEILYAFKDLSDLTQQRYDRCDAWVKEVEAFERYKVEYNAIVDMCAAQTHTLNKYKTGATVCEDLCKHIDEWMRKAAEQIAQLADSVSAEGDQLALTEQTAYLDVFRKFYLGIGEVAYRKEKRVQEVERETRNCEFQIQACKQVLDPDLQNYKDSLRELMQRRLQLQTKLDSLRVRSSKRASEFMPHEEALRAFGVQFDSPLIEMQERTLETRHKVLETRKTFQEKDNVEVVKEEETIHQLDTVTRQARKTGLSSLIHPLSPTFGDVGADGMGGAAAIIGPGGNDVLIKSALLPRNALAGTPKAGGNGGVQSPMR